MENTVEKIAQICAEMKQEDQAKVLCFLHGMQLGAVQQSKSA